MDTAKYYNNEKDVGKAVRESGLRREEVFVTSKIWLTEFGYKRTQKVGGLSHSFKLISGTLC